MALYNFELKCVVGAVLEAVDEDSAVGAEFDDGVGVVGGGGLFNHTFERQIVNMGVAAMVSSVVVALKYGTHLRVAFQDGAYLVGVAHKDVFIDIRIAIEQLMHED